MYFLLILLVVSISVMANQSLASRSSSYSTRSDPFTVIRKFLSRLIGRPRCALASKTTTRHRDITDDMMLEILSRVPGRSLVRLRLVCKRWESMFSDPHFIRLQLGYASKNPTTFFCYPNVAPWGWVSFYTFGLRAFISSETNAHMLVLGRNFTLQMLLHMETRYSISNACDGLIVFYGTQIAYVTNPCTRECLDLPKVVCHQVSPSIVWPVIGLGFDASIGKYKVVRMFVRDVRLCWECEVLTLGTDHSWRLLRDAPPYPITCFSPAYANGYIYWTIDARVPQGSKCILAFDVSREKFTTIQLPQFRPKHNTVARHVYMKFLDGNLCLVDHRWCFDIEGKFHWPLIDIHVLKNHYESIWTETHSMCFKGEDRNTDIDQRHVFCNLKSIQLIPVATLNGKVLLRRYSTDWILHDPKTGSSSIVILPDREVIRMRILALPFICADSIVPINCLRASPSSIT